MRLPALFLAILIGLFLTSLITRSKKLRGMTVFRTGLFVPQVMSPVVVGIIWRWLFTLDGPINQIFAAIGLDGWVRPWLGDFTFALPAIGAVATWYFFGFCMVIFLSGMQRIDPALFEAARVDGARAWQSFRWITLPSLLPEIRVVLLLTVGGAATAPDAGPAVPACVTVKPEVRYGGLGYDHVVNLTNGCPKTVDCVVKTDVNPDPQPVTVKSKETVSVMTWRGSPARDILIWQCEPARVLARGPVPRPKGRPCRTIRNPTTSGRACIA